MTLGDVAHAGEEINRVWDGKPIQRILASEQAFILRNVRLSMHLMAQPTIAANLLDDGVLADQGFLARFLISAPDLRDTPRTWSAAERWAEPCIAVYERMVENMLKLPVPLNEHGEIDRRVLRLSLGAFERHKRLYDQIQEQLVQYGSLLSVKGLAEKAPEHACRLAATLAFADDPKVTEISAEHYGAAVALVHHYVSEALRLKFRQEPNSRRADELLNWLKKLYAEGTTSIDARFIQQNAPRGSGCRSSIEDLLKVGQLLQQRGWLRPVQLDGRAARSKSRTSWDICMPKPN